MTLICHTDDRPRRDNGVSVDESTGDEHGSVPLVEREPHPDDLQKIDSPSECLTSGRAIFIITYFHQAKHLQGDPV